MPFLNPSYESGICHDLIRQRGQFSASCGWHILPLRVVNYRFFRGIQQHCKILNMESSVKHNASVNEEDSPKKHSHSSLSHKFIFSRKEASVVCNHLDETELTREKQYCSNSLSVNLTFLWHIAVSGKIFILFIDLYPQWKVYRLLINSGSILFGHRFHCLFVLKKVSATYQLYVNFVFYQFSVIIHPRPISIISVSH